MLDEGSVITVFYSWQSDTAGNINRNFIEDTLIKAIKEAGKDCEVQKAIRDDGLAIDKDTTGVPGTPPITQTILEKISQCGIFVGDLTFVGKTDKGEPIPNPNVLIEYGYALRSVGYSRIIMVMNTVSGEPTEESMPFNLRHQRFPIQYHLREDSNKEDRKQVKVSLIADLKSAIVEIIKAKGLLDAKASAQEVPSTTNPSTFLQPGEKIGYYSYYGKDYDLFIPDGPQMFLRMIPTKKALDIDSPTKALDLVQSGMLQPLGTVVSGFSFCRNIYGAISFNNHDSNATNVTQLFKNNELWGIDSKSISITADEKADLGFGFIPYEVFKSAFLLTLENYLKFASETLKLAVPLRVVAGLTEIEGYRITAPTGLQFNGYQKFGGKAVESQIICENIIESYSTKPWDVLFPFFRKVYEYFGVTLPEKWPET